MSNTRWDSLLDQDWSESWDSLPAAPDLVPRPKTSQITIRLSPSLLARLKRVAAARSLPYHSLARSWLIEMLRQSGDSEHVTDEFEPQTEQLNLKLDQEILDRIKARGHELNVPYHRLAR